MKLSTQRPVATARGIDDGARIHFAVPVEVLVEHPRRQRFTELYRWPLTLAVLALACEVMLAAWRGPLPA